MENSLKWGILGPGKISLTILRDFRLAGLEVLAVGSRSLDRAKEYAEANSVPRAYGSYQDLVSDPDLDIIYVSTTQNAHFDNAKLALEAGKHVLVEKPFTINALEAKKLQELAASKGLFLMEAMWTRFLPNHMDLFEKLHAGVIGDPLYVIADHNQDIPPTRAPRLYDPALGGGALLDLGVYPISFAHRVFGKPQKISTTAELSDLGIDLAVGTIFEYQRNAMALCHSSIRVNGPLTAAIMGTVGRIELRRPFFEHSEFTVYNQAGEATYSYNGKIEGRGMQFQGLEVERCIRAGLTESPIMRVSETVEIMEVMDEIRAQAGIVYPGEN
jgi:predicted dehydrogenase